MEKENQTKTVWVIGASSGLGLAVAQRFEADGWVVISGARSFRDEASADRGTAHLHIDVTDAESCGEFIRRALAFSARIDVLVYCSAILNLGSCEKTAAKEYDRVMQTNFIGMTRMVSAALPVMRAQGEGCLVFFSSINGLLGIPFQSAYTASKHAIEGYAECLSMETEPYGIQVCLVEPGDHRGGSDRTRLHASAEDQDSPYWERYESACAVIHRDESGGLYPAALAEKVLRNVKRKKMKFRLRIAKPDQHLAVLLHSVLPNGLNAKILSSYYRAGKKNK